MWSILLIRHLTSSSHGSGDICLYVPVCLIHFGEKKNERVVCESVCRIRVRNQSAGTQQKARGALSLSTDRSLTGKNDGWEWMIPLGSDEKLQQGEKRDIAKRDASGNYSFFFSLISNRRFLFQQCKRCKIRNNNSMRWSSPPEDMND